MQTEFKITNKATGVEEDVLSLTFNAGFVIAATRTQSVRFEKLEGGLMNENFVLDEGTAVTLESEIVAEEIASMGEAVVETPAPEPTPEPVADTAVVDETADVVVDVDTTVGVDLATGTDATVETVVEPTEPVAPVTTE